LKHSFAALLAALVAGVVLLDCGGEEPAAAPFDPGLPDADVPADGEAPEPPRPETERSGTRFRVDRVHAKWDDGTELTFFGGFLDRELLEPCKIRQAGADVWACLPDFLDQATEGFSDAACSTPALGVSDDPSTHWVYWGLRCAPHYGRLNRSLVKDGNLYRRDPITQECVVFQSSQPVMPVPEEVPASTFGTFTRKLETAPFYGEKSGARLVLESYRFDSPDGAMEWREPRIVDKTRSSSGSIERAADGTLRFATAYEFATPNSLTYTDSSCTQQGVIGFQHDRSCNDPFRPRDGFESFNGASCFGKRVVERPATPPLEATYRLFGATCRQDWDYYPRAPDERGAYPTQPLAEVPVSDLVEITKTSVPTTWNAIPGKKLDVRMVVHTSSDGLSVRAREPSLYLRALDLPCKDRIGDCALDIPEGFRDATLFADAACTAELTPMPSRCGAPRPSLWVGTNDIRRIPDGALVQPTSVFRQKDGACVEEPPSPEYIFAIRRLVVKGEVAFTGAMPRQIDHKVITE
jgi:hypothetical protein